MLEVHYHLQSLSLTMVFVSVLTFFCLAPALWRFPSEFRTSLRSWIVGTALIVSTDVIFFVGLEIAYLDTLLTAIAGLGAAEWLHAIRLFNGKTRRVVWPYIAIAIGTAVSLAAPSYPTGVLVTSVLFSILYLGLAWNALQIKNPERSNGGMLLVAVFTIIAVVMLGRLGLFATGIRSGAPSGFTTLPRALMFVVASIGPVLGSLAFVVVCGERVGARLLHWSLTDSMTGIPNRRALLDSLSRALSAGQRQSVPVALLTIDIDLFKRVNDTAGHAVGDEVLIQMAALLTETSRSSDTAGRLGGEEFAVVMAGADLAAATTAAERLRATVEATPFNVDTYSFDLTVSIGVAVAKEGESAMALLDRVDAPLYDAKNQGRNRVVLAKS